MNFIHMFNMIDTDNSGEITKTELVAFMKVNNFTEDFVDNWLRLFDFNQKGIITMDDYCERLGLVIDEEMHKKIRKQRPSVLNLSGLDDYDDFVDVDSQMEQHVIHISTNKPLSTPTISSSTYPHLKSPTKTPEIQNISPPKKTGFSILKFFKTKDSKKKSTKESKDNTVTDVKPNKILNRLSASLPRTSKRSPTKDDIVKNLETDNKNLKVPPKRSKTLELHSSKSDITKDSSEKNKIENKIDNQIINRTSLKSDFSNAKEISRENSKRLNVPSKTDDKNIKSSQEILNTDKSTNLSRFGKIINNIRHFSSKNQSPDKVDNIVVNVEVQKEKHSPKEKSIKPPSIQILKDSKKSKTKDVVSKQSHEPTVLKSHPDSSPVKEKSHYSKSEVGKTSKDNESKNIKIKIAKSASAHEVKKKGTISSSDKNRNVITDINEANQKLKSSSIRSPMISISNEDGVTIELTGSLKSKNKSVDSKSVDKHNKKEESVNYFFGTDLDKVKNRKNVEKVKHLKTNSFEDDITKNVKDNLSRDKSADHLNDTEVKTAHSLSSKSSNKSPNIIDHGRKDKSLKHKHLGDVNKSTKNDKTTLDDNLNDINEETIKATTSRSLTSKPIEINLDMSSKVKDKHVKSLKNTGKHIKDDKSNKKLVDNVNEMDKEMVEIKTHHSLPNRSGWKKPHVELEKRNTGSKIISVGDSDIHIGDKKSNNKYIGNLNEMGKEITEVKLNYVLNSRSIKTGDGPKERSEQLSRSLSQETNKNMEYNKSNNLLMNILSEVGERQIEVKTNQLLTSNPNQTVDNVDFKGNEKNLKSASSRDSSTYVGDNDSNQILSNVFNENETNKDRNNDLLFNKPKETKICDDWEIIDLIEGIRTEINTLDGNNKHIIITSKDSIKDSEGKILPPEEHNTANEEKINKSLKNRPPESKAKQNDDIPLLRNKFKELNNKLVNDKSDHSIMLVNEMFKESNLGDRIKEIVIDNESQNDRHEMLQNPENSEILGEQPLSVLHNIVSNKTMKENQNEVAQNVKLIKCDLPIEHSNENATFGFEKGKLSGKQKERDNIVSDRFENLNNNYKIPKEQIPVKQNTEDYDMKLMLDKNIIPGKAGGRVKDSATHLLSQTNNLSSSTKSSKDLSLEDSFIDYVNSVHPDNILRNNEDHMDIIKSTIFPQDKTFIEKSSNLDKMPSRTGEENFKNREQDGSKNTKSDRSNLVYLKDNKENVVLNMKPEYAINDISIGRDVLGNIATIESTKQIKENANLKHFTDRKEDKFPNYNLLKFDDNPLYSENLIDATTSEMTSQNEIFNNKNLTINAENDKGQQFVFSNLGKSNSFGDENETSHTLTIHPNENIEIKGVKVENEACESGHNTNKYISSALIEIKNGSVVKKCLETLDTSIDHQGKPVLTINQEISSKPLFSGENTDKRNIPGKIKNVVENRAQDSLEIKQAAIKEMVFDNKDGTIGNRFPIDSDFVSQFKLTPSNLRIIGDGSKDILPKKKETESEVIKTRRPNFIYKPNERRNKDLLTSPPLGNITNIDAGIKPYIISDLSSPSIKNIDGATTVLSEYELGHKKREDLAAQLSKYFRNKESQRDINKKIKIIRKDLDDVFLPDILNNIVDIYEGRITIEDYNCEEVIKRFLDKYYDQFWNVIISKNDYELYFTYESMLIFQYDNLSFIIWKTPDTIY